jgi:riboflavin synthase
METKKFYLDKIATLQSCVGLAKTQIRSLMNILDTTLHVAEKANNIQFMEFVDPLLEELETIVANMEETAQQIGTGEE